MKPTNKQKEVINIISNIIKTWENSNDLSSPTIKSDIKKELNKLDCFVNGYDDILNLQREIVDILHTIKYRIKD